MKTPTKLFLLAAIPVLVAVSSVRADEPGTTPPAADHPRMQEAREHRMQRLDEKLHLTADQKTKISAIWDKTEAEARAARSEASSSAQTNRRAKRREMMKAAHDEVRAVLTPEQQTIFDTMPAERPAGGSRRNDGK
jgi:Spy/CpxP family protein refolding chaperone